MANTVTLLDEMGTGDPYLRPDGTTGPFFRVPEQLWTTGMIGELSGPALVMYLMILYHYRRPSEGEVDPAEGRQRVPPAPPVWFSNKGFRDNHGLPEDSRLAGIQALQEAGVIEIDSVSIDSAGASGHRRFRRQMLTLTPRFEPPLPGAAPKANSTSDTAEIRAAAAAAMQFASTFSCDYVIDQLWPGRGVVAQRLDQLMLNVHAGDHHAGH